MRPHPLTHDIHTLLRLNTPTTPTSQPKLLRPHYAITDWFNTPPSPAHTWSRYIFDAEHPHGLHGDYFQVARVHWAHESSAWRWHVSLSPAAYSDISRKESSRDITPRAALSRADAYLELYAICPGDFRRTRSGSRILEPYVPPLLHPTRPQRLTSWHFRDGTTSSSDYITRFLRFWVHLPESLPTLPARHRTHHLVEVTGKSSKASLGASITHRGPTTYECAIRVPPGRWVRWTARDLEVAFDSIAENLEDAGCVEMQPELPGVPKE